MSAEEDPSELPAAEGEEVDATLVPIEVLEADEPPGRTPQLLAGMHAVLLGYEYVPLQTPPDRFRKRHEDQARRRLTELAEQFRSTAAEVTERLAFVHDPSRAIAQAADRDTCGSVLLARPAASMDDVLVPAPGETHLPRLLDTVATVLRRDGIQATLLRVTEDGDRRDEAELLVAGARDELVARGVDAELVSGNVRVAENRLDAIADEAERFDALVLGEFERSLQDAVFGEVHERVARRYSGPMLIVRRAIEEEGPEVPPDV